MSAENIEYFCGESRIGVKLCAVAKIGLSIISGRAKL